LTKFARLALAGLLAMAAGGIARADDAQKAKIGVLRLSSSAPVFIAQDKGYFREAGLDIELKVLRRGAADRGGDDLGRRRFRHHGVHRRALQSRRQGHAEGDRRHEPREGRLSLDRLLRQQQRLRCGLKTPKDLAGKRIAVTQVGSSFHYSLGLLADKYGFKLADVKVLPLQSLSNAAAALKGETVDAALLPISTARALVDSGGAKFLGWVGDETPWQLGAVFAAPKTLANKASVTKLLAALVRADREYHDVILASVKDGKADINDKTRPLLEIIAKYTNCRWSRWSAIAPI
jgi:NitT/TauT family transport system substrate-binding protein